MPFFKLIRLPNLGIVALTQYLLYYLVIRRALLVSHIEPQLNDLQLGLLALITVLITGSGYIFNDIIDLKADKLNRPDKVLLEEVIPLQIAYWAAGVMLLTGFLLSFYLAMILQRIPCLFIYPLAVIGLLGYNIRWKGVPLIGNLVVALYCAGVAGILWIAERPSLQMLKIEQAEVFYLTRSMVFWYMLFAFFSNLIREIVKDMEDQAGDREAGLRTIPIAWGEKTAKMMASVFSLILLAIIGYYGWQFGQVFERNVLAYLLMGILLPISAVIIRQIRARNPAGFHQSSQLWKGIMVLGLLLLLFF